MTIQAILRAIRERIGPVHAGRHLALVDSDAEVDFLNELQHHNIDIVRYSADEGHKELWEGLEEFGKRRVRVPSDGSGSAEVFAYARRYLAAALARRRLSPHIRPLRQAVTEGMILELLRNAGAAGLSVDDLAVRVSEQLHVQKSAAELLVERSLQSLATDGLYESESDGRLRTTKPNGGQGDLKVALDVLVEGAVQRLLVREHGKDSPATRAVLNDYFEYLVLRRGWDMGAAYASRRPPQAMVVEDLLKRLLQQQGSTSVPSPHLVRAVEGVLLSPSDAEASVLSELGRLAFALELVRQAPQDALFTAHVMPNRVYLDANVLLPAIVEGHPYNKLYGEAMDKLIVSASASSSGVDVCAYYGFLNEVVSHLRLARQEVRAQGNRLAEYLEREVRLSGAVNMNVFLAGFARTLIGGQRLTFDEYLAKFAPYNTEHELAAWLGKRGIRIVDQRQMNGQASQYADFLHHFEKEFSHEVATKMRTATLVAHDALQAAVLLGDWGRGERPILVSADRRLREAVACSPFPSVGSAMLSGTGFVQMIDFFVGALGDERSMAQLLWSARASSVTEKVRRYFIDLALTQYDAALAMNMETIVRELTEDVTFALEREAEKEGYAGADDERLSLGKYVEAFEPRFYELMKAEQQKLQEKNE